MLIGGRTAKTGIDALGSPVLIIMFHTILIMGLYT